MSKSRILFQMTGSIACYKACNVISKLVQAGHEVQVVASPSALEFVGAATLEGLTGKPVVSDLFSKGNIMDHIHLVRWADLILVAPATANYINKIAQGIGDDLLTTQFLAHDFKKPFLIAPAMNTAMYLHPVTQKSIGRLRELGVQILETASGVLACGEVGWGKLLDPELIFKEIEQSLGKSNGHAAAKPVRGEAFKVLITSGGTQEPVDEVRVLSNISTGSTGAAIADQLIALGFDVTYLHAKNAALPQGECHKVSFLSFQDLQKDLFELLAKDHYAAVIHAAAVSDYSVKPSSGKISSEQEEISLHLTRNPKLISKIKEISKNKGVLLVGFKMTAHADSQKQKEAVGKIFAGSHADVVVHNDTSEISEKAHIFHWYGKEKDSAVLPGKSALAHKLGQYLFDHLNQKAGT